MGIEDRWAASEIDQTLEYDFEVTVQDCRPTADRLPSLSVKPAEEAWSYVTLQTYQT
jgi:hypothetical protein